MCMKACWTAEVPQGIPIVLHIQPRVVLHKAPSSVEVAAGAQVGSLIIPFVALWGGSWLCLMCIKRVFSMHRNSPKHGICSAYLVPCNYLPVPSLRQNRNSIRISFVVNTWRRILANLSQKAFPSTFHFIIVSVIKEVTVSITKEIHSYSKEATLHLYNHLCLCWAARQITCEMSVSLRVYSAYWLCADMLVGSQRAPLLCFCQCWGYSRLLGKCLVQELTMEV